MSLGFVGNEKPFSCKDFLIKLLIVTALIVNPSTEIKLKLVLKLLRKK